MSLGARIKERRKQMGLTQPDFAKAIGSSLATIRRWESGRTSPDANAMAKIAEALNTSTSYLIGELNAPRQVQARSLGEEARVTRVPGEMVRVQVLSFSACMGKGFDNESEMAEVIDEIWLPRDDVGVDYPLKPYAVTVEGDSMAPYIENGVRVVVNPNIPLGNGDVCLARFLMGGYFRDAVKFYYPRADGGFILKSSEVSGVPPREFSLSDVDEGEVEIKGRITFFYKGQRI